MPIEDISGINQSIKKHSFQFFSQDEFVVTSFKGDVRLKDLLDAFSELVRHSLFIHNMAVCYDFSEAVIDIDVNETELFYQFSTEMRGKRGDSYQLAFVCNDALTKTSVDIYRLMFSRTEIDVEIFESVSIAKEWIIETKKMAITLGVQKN